MPKPRRALTPTPWFNLAFFNALDPILKIVLGVSTLIGALYGFASVIVDLVGWLQRPRLDLYMSDVVWPIVEPNGDECAINIQFVVYNPTRRMVALRRLEAKLTRPSWVVGTATYPQGDFPLEWYRLIKGGPN